MDLDGFRKQLKKKGKKEHVVDELVQQVLLWEAFLRDQRGQTLENAGVEDFQAYRRELETLYPGRSGNAIRGIAMAYSFLGDQPMAALVAESREESISSKRKVFALKDFRGVNPQHIDRLAQLGISNVEHMLAAGRTPAERHALADRSGVPYQSVLELVKLSDLSRLGAVKSIRARLYLDAGLDTPDKVAAYEPHDLLAKMRAYVEGSGFEGVAPLPKEINNLVARAVEIEKIVEYEA